MTKPSCEQFVEEYLIAAKRDRERINAQTHDVKMIVRFRSLEKRLEFDVVPSRVEEAPLEDDAPPPPPLRLIIIIDFF